ncbi:hypothetical protein M426DRAFT_99077 [Hypoxylon sp. CI-4A]|nr:hypothetical protein M426DRAFT_99077 [Hypoxylon sp. CI-4A]
MEDRRESCCTQTWAGRGLIPNSKLSALQRQSCRSGTGSEFRLKRANRVVGPLSQPAVLAPGAWERHSTPTKEEDTCLRSGELGAILILAFPSEETLVEVRGGKAGRTNSKQSRFSHGISHILPPFFSLTLIISVPSLLHRKRAFRDSMRSAIRALKSLKNHAQHGLLLLSLILSPFAAHWASVQSMQLSLNGKLSADLNGPQHSTRRMQVSNKNSDIDVCKREKERTLGEKAEER